jgi:predicted nucleotidyltransferase
MTTLELANIDVNEMRRLLSANPIIQGAALYGSAARGDLEVHSDVDLLLVCPATQKLVAYNYVRDALASSLERLSLTVYSERELRFLQSAGSLFLLHLSREAILLLDKNDFLRPLLADFRPKESYRTDFQTSLRLIDPLRMVVESAPNDIHRLSYIYSLFRVFGVYLLAEAGIYEFSKSRMARLLTARFPEQKGSIELLSTLRSLNSNFFTGGPEVKHDTEPQYEVARSAKALASVAQVEIEVSYCSYHEAVCSFREALGERSRALDYRLRMWFLLLVYDGLNLYSSKVGHQPLTSLSEDALLGFVRHDTPKPVQRAVRETTTYLHRYPLKYFLSEKSKIGAQNSRAILQGISEELSRA